MEFDIRIGTLLDTSQAEEQLQNFINKYSGDNDFKINLKISGDEKLEGIEKSLTNIKNLAKSIDNIKMDFDGGGINVDTAFNKTIEKVKNDIRGISKELGTQIGSGVEESTKNVTKSLEEEVDDVQKKIKSMVKNLENLKLNPFADSKEIDNIIAKLNDLGSTNFDKFGNLGLSLVKEEIESITNAYSDMYTTAKNKQLDDIFQTTKVEPLRQQILALKEVLDFKGMDTSSLDKLLQDLKKTSEYGNDLKKVKTIFADVKSSFGNIQKSMGEKGITSAETAIKRLLEYKEKIQEEIRMEVDTSKIQKAEEDIKKIDEAIDRLKMNADESIVKNLFDMSELKNMENMEKVSKTLQNNLGKLGDVFDKLKTKATQLSKSEFVDTIALEMLEERIKGIDNAFESLDFDNLRKLDVDNLKGGLEDLERLINGIKEMSDKTELQFNFDNDLEKVTKQLNGLESAFIKMGQSTEKIDKLKQNLSEISDIAKTDLNKASTEIKNISKYITDLGKENNLGDISGSLTQYAKYIKEIEALMKKLATTKDMNFANTIKEEIRQIELAMEQLKRTFDQDGINFAEALRTDMLDRLGEKFGQEVKKIESQADKLNVALYKISQSATFEGIDGDKFAESFNKAADKVEELQNALRQANNMKLDIKGIEKLKSDLEEAQNSVEKLKKKKIELDCNQVIQKMEQLKNSVENVDEALERIGGADAINRIVSDFENGVITFDKATASIKKFDDALDKIGSSSSKVSKSFDGIDTFGSKIEGTFNTIKDAFSNFTLGALLEEGIENLAYGVTETITGLDEAMTHLRMVSDDINLDGTGYTEMANQARELAISVGQSVEDVIEGMATAYQAGAQNIQQASAIAEKSAMLQNVSELDATGASQAIASLMNQYYSMDTALSQNRDNVKGATKDYSNLEQAIDLINYAGNNYAISTQGVTEALQNGGAVLSNYGVTLSDSVALISGANESLQDPSRIGNGLKFLVA